MTGNPDRERLSRLLVCPECRGPLTSVDAGVRCPAEGRAYVASTGGYLGFVSTRPDTGAGTQDEYALRQHESGAGPLERYLRPWLEQEPFDAVLDVGCGIGHGVSILAEEGYAAYGVDLPDLDRFWSQAGNNPNHFFAADALRLPFPDGMFDAAWSFGVLEHIGTEDGFAHLTPTYQESRQQYASELLRVLKPGGRVLIACPHKHFPIDIQHRPTSRSTARLQSVRGWLWDNAGVNVHKPWGHYYLPSYRDVERWFDRPAQPLSLRGYFGFTAFQHKALKPFRTAATAYVENLPVPVRRTPLNPYLLAEIRK